VAGNGTTRNLTARGVPATDSGSTGVGRIYYQTPVIHVMGRELSSFADLQKSLAQLGFNGGNVLLRLSFRTTQEPLEEAMTKITEYFRAFGDETSPAATEATVTPEQTVLAQPTDQTFRPPSSTEGDPTPISTSISQPEPSRPPSLEPVAGPSISDRPVTVYRPPSSTTPHSALTTYDEEDYVPSIEHAKSHQEQLKQISRNRRLLSDSEIAAKAAAEQEKLASVKDVDVKIRFPEQSQVVAKFERADTGATLYSFVRSCLNDTIAGEKFLLSLFGGGGGGQIRAGGSKNQTIPDSDQTYLIRDVGMRGRVLINFTWDDQASLAARGIGSNLLKPELRSQAQDIQIPSVPNAVEEDSSGRSGLGKLGAALKGEDGKSSGRKGGGGGVPKWFKMPGKK
jgi:tether containing UBX domain for GLUT4